MINGIKIIGLCGRSGCGKGHVCKLLLQYGIPCIDTDFVYRNTVLSSDKGSSPCLKELVDEFGTDILGADGELDRAALSKTVFAKGNHQKLQRLNLITHKYILEQTMRLIEDHAKKGVKEVVIDAPVLFESGFDKLCDVILCVTAPDSVAVERICRRDNKSVEEARQRLASQKPEAELVSLCDGVIRNDGNLDVETQLKKIVAELIRRDK